MTGSPQPTDDASARSGDHAEQDSDAGRDLPPSRLARLIALIVVLVLAGLAARANADTLRVGTPRYDYDNGAITVRARATAPPESDYAAGLYRGHCPPAPRLTDAYTPVESEPAVLYAWPSAGETGAFDLCVWIWHENDTAGARYEHPVVIPASVASPSYVSPLTNSHPTWWIAAGVLVLLGVFWFRGGWIALIGLGAWMLVRRLRGHGHRQRHSRRQRRREEERILDLQDRANTDSPVPVGEAQPTAEYPAIPHADAEGSAGEGGG